jgi:hypothetical protein
MSEAKIFSYRYIDNEEADQDEESDLTGTLQMPRLGDIIYRREKPCKVTGVYASAAAQTVPLFRIYLADMTKTEYLN